MENAREYEALMETIRGRRSVRSFLPRAVPEDLVERLCEAARWAPSAGNRQPFRVLVVDDATLKEAMAGEVRAVVERIVAAARPDRAPDLATYLENFSHFVTAPVVLAVVFRQGPDLLALGRKAGVADPAVDGQRMLVDAVSSASAAIQNLLLAAHTLGLGACWMTGPLVAADGLRRCLEVTKGWEIAALVPVGYADEEPQPPKRRPLQRLIQRRSAT
jgi:nitroreductase